MPIAFGQKFHFDAQETGLQFTAIIVGCVLGKHVSGPMSDWFIKWMRKTNGRWCPADRLWLSYLAFSIIFAGLLTWSFQLRHATEWNVAPCIGAAIASFGNQMHTTILTTFAVESKRERAAQVGVFGNACRQVYDFVRPLESTFDRKPVPLTVRSAWTFLLPGHVCRPRPGRGCCRDDSHRGWVQAESALCRSSPATAEETFCLLL